MKNTLHKKCWLPALSCLLIATTPSSQAAMIINVEQVGRNIVISGSGTLNLRDLTKTGTNTDRDRIRSTFLPDSSVSAPIYEFRNQGAYDIYTGATFDNGSGSIHRFATTQGSFSATVGRANKSRDFYYGVLAGELRVPEGYVSGTALSFSHTIAITQAGSALRSNKGSSYTATWGTGRNADSSTLNLIDNSPASVPEPTAGILSTLGCLAILARRRR